MMLKQLLGGPIVANLIYIAAELGIADMLADGPRTVMELAAKTGASSDKLHRVLRALSLFGIFARESDTYSLTPLSNLLRENVPGSMRTVARFQTHPITQKAFSNMIAGIRSDGTIPFDHTFGMDFFEYLKNNPGFADLFNRFMGTVTSKVSNAVADAYDFSAARTIVDVGGGNGELLRTILKRFPDGSGTILDAPILKKQVESRIAADGLQGRCKFEPGDFFQKVPPNADIYLLKSVIHDWDDARAETILRNVRNAMSDSSALLVVEGIINPVEPSMDVVMGDIIMLTMAPGKERTIAEFESLFHKVGLQLTQTIRTSAAPTILKTVTAK